MSEGRFSGPHLTPRAVRAGKYAFFDALVVPGGDHPLKADITRERLAKMNMSSVPIIANVSHENRIVDPSRFTGRVVRCGQRFPQYAVTFALNLESPTGRKLTELIEAGRLREVSALYEMCRGEGCDLARSRLNAYHLAIVTEGFLPKTRIMDGGSVGWMPRAPSDAAEAERFWLNLADKPDIHIYDATDANNSLPILTATWPTHTELVQRGLSAAVDANGNAITTSCGSEPCTCGCKDAMSNGAPQPPAPQPEATQVDPVTSMQYVQQAQDLQAQQQAQQKPQQQQQQQPPAPENEPAQPDAAAQPAQTNAIPAAVRDASFERILNLPLSVLQDFEGMLRKDETPATMQRLADLRSAMSTVKTVTDVYRDDRDKAQSELEKTRAELAKLQAERDAAVAEKATAENDARDAMRATWESHALSAFNGAPGFQQAMGASPAEFSDVLAGTTEGRAIMIAAAKHVAAANTQRREALRATPAPPRSTTVPDNQAAVAQPSAAAEPASTGGNVSVAAAAHTAQQPQQASAMPMSMMQQMQQAAAAQNAQPKLSPFEESMQLLHQAGAMGRYVASTFGGR